jgi:tetratricopeptide (TPR) repeat protein
MARTICYLLELSHAVIAALENKLLAYRDQEDYEAMVETCDDLIRRYEFDAGEGIADRVGRTMIRKASALNKLGRTAQEVACYDKVAQTYGGWPEPELRKHAAVAMISKAVTLNDADQTAAEMECYEEVIRAYAEDADERVRALAAQAMIYKGLSLRAIAEDAAEDTGIIDTAPEIACYDGVIDRYGAEDHVEIQRAVAEALLRKGEILLETGETAAAAACCDALIEGFAGIKDEEIAETLKEARTLRAEC